MAKLSDQDLVTLLQTYRDEGETARKSGWGERDEIWENNLDLYFNRFDFSRKAAWQSKQPMPEGSLYIDRWAAALRSALIVPGVWYSVETPVPELEPAFRKFLGYWLERCGTTPTGYPTSFDRVFEDQAKLAALMSAAAAVTWEPGKPGNIGQRDRVRVDTVDPREVFLDPTYRGLYRIRRLEKDYYQLLADARGNPSYNMPEIERLGAARSQEEEADREELVGHGTKISSARKPITLDEYLCVILDDEGRDIYGGRQLCIVANGNYLIYGPTPSPYLHGCDWVVFSSAISVPLAVYGKTYVETWGDIARTFVKMTNLIIDAGMMASMNAFALVADALANPEDAKTGVFPNKTFVLAPGTNVDQFIKEIKLGDLPTTAFSVWTALKQEMREGAATNDLDLGQAVPKGDVTATEINAVQAGGTALIQSIAASLETGCVDPILNLVFQTGLQHFSEDDQALHLSMGDEYFQMFVTRREEFIRLAPAFRARGISGLLERGQKLKAMLQIVQAMGSSPILQQALLQSIGFGKFVRQLIVLVGLDPNDFPPEPQQMALAQQGPRPVQQVGGRGGA
jgi:hypothetical protein